MRTRVNQAGAWGIAVIIGLIFFGIGLAMFWKVADNHSKDKIIIDRDTDHQTPAMPDDQMDSDPIMEPENSGEIDRGKTEKLSSSEQKKKMEL